MYRDLDPRQILLTAESLGTRIGERFPASGLSRVGRELIAVARESEARLERLRRPNWPIRVGVGVGLLVIAGIVASAALTITVRNDVPALAELLQGLEAAINDIVFLGAAVFFLTTVESRLKRRRALAALHELRSVAHIIDMHQLTKDPERILSPRMETGASPKVGLTRFELVRYLDYCSELLSITSKLAALHVQALNDPVILDAVNAIQALTQGLSAKIWQKIMILDSVVSRAESPAASVP